MTSINTTIKLNGWWGKESALLEEQSYLYLLKINLIERLIKNKYMNESDKDRQNKEPHIKLCNKKDNPRDQARYQVIDELPITISMKNITIHKDQIELFIDNKTHMTLAFKKKIGLENNSDLRFNVQSVIDDLANGNMNIDDNKQNENLNSNTKQEVSNIESINNNNNNSNETFLHETAPHCPSCGYNFKAKVTFKLI